MLRHRWLFRIAPFALATIILGAEVAAIRWIWSLGEGRSVESRLARREPYKTRRHRGYEMPMIAGTLLAIVAGGVAFSFGRQYLIDEELHLRALEAKASKRESRNPS